MTQFNAQDTALKDQICACINGKPLSIPGSVQDVFRRRSLPPSGSTHNDPPAVDQLQGPPQEGRHVKVGPRCRALHEVKGSVG